MSKKTLRIAGWALGLSMAVAGVGVAVGASRMAGSKPLMVNADVTYTKIASYDFSSGNTSDGTEYDTDKLKTRFANSAQTGAGLSDIVTAVSAASKTYAGYTSYYSFGLKFGTSGSNGTFTVTTATNVCRVVVVTAGWGTTDNLKVGSAAAQTPGVAYSGTNPLKTLTYDITASKSIQFTYAKRGFIQSIDFYEEEVGTKYSISDDVDNGSLSSTVQIPEGDELDITIIPDSHYHLPDDFTVTMGGDPLTIDEDYLYDSDSGAFFIASVTGDVVISGECLEDPKYSVTYVAGDHGTGDVFVVANQYAGSYSLLAFSSLASEGFEADAGYKFKGYLVNETEYNAGDSITLSGNTTVTVLFEALPKSITIDETSFTKAGSGSGYDPYNDSAPYSRAPIDGYQIGSSNVMIQSHNVQFRRSPTGSLWNGTAFDGVNLIKLTGSNSSADTKVQVSFSASTPAAAGTLGTCVRIGGSDYWINKNVSGAKYFYITDASSSGTFTCTSIKVVDEDNAATLFAEMYLGAYACDGEGTSAPTLNSGYTADLISSLYGNLANDTKTILQNAVKTHSDSYGTDKVKEFGQRYWLICKNHGTATYDFMGLNGTVSFAATASAFDINMGLDSSWALAVAFASIGLVAAAGGLFLIQRKRRSED